MKYIVLGALLLCSMSLVAEHQNALKKVYFHRGAHQGIHTKSHPHIELANVVFYFEEKPRIESSVVQKKSETLHRLFLPNVVVSPELHVALQAVHDQAKEYPFDVQFVAKSSPTEKGLEITLTYPTDTVGVKYDYFNSIGLQKGLTLQLVNKELIQRINHLGRQIITTASLDTPRVFIDCGHGGTDSGAACHSVKEKDVSLEVGLTVADTLRANGILVQLSRERDEFVSLDMRTTLANQSNADLFVSIHANSALNSAAHGIETYFFTTDLLDEGDCFLSTLWDRNKLKKELAQKCALSNRLASCVHGAVLKTVQSEHSVVDRRVKPAVSQVLLGAQMPAVLVEVGFVTHAYESQLLSQKTYQERLASGITTGIMQYLGRA